MDLTPRTDDQLLSPAEAGQRDGHFVSAEFAREVERETHKLPTLIAALKVIATARTKHLRSFQMQECINEQKQLARNALADIGEGW